MVKKILDGPAGSLVKILGIVFATITLTVGILTWAYAGNLDTREWAQDQDEKLITQIEKNYVDKESWSKIAERQEFIAKTLEEIKNSIRRIEDKLDKD